MSGLNDHRLPSLDALLALQVAARMETFERAADSLSITASALRKRITGLEHLLGISLFNRQGGVLTLTARGQTYLEQITPVIDQLIAIPLHQRLSQRRLRLIVCCPPTFARHLLVPRLHEYIAAYPDIDLQVQLSAPLLGGNSGAWDINISGNSVRVAREQRFLDEHLYPLASPALLTAFAPVERATDVVRLPLLRSPLEPWIGWFNAANLVLPEPDQGPAIFDLGLLMDMAANGQGVVLARPSLARTWLEDGRLITLGGLGSVPLFHYEVSVQHPSPEAEVFVTWLKQVCHDAVVDGVACLNRVW